MPEIYVSSFNELSSLGERFSQISSRVSDVNTKFSTVITKLDWDIKLQSNINFTAKSVTNKLNSHQESLNNYSNFVFEAIERYKKLDEYDHDARDDFSAADIAELILGALLPTGLFGVGGLLNILSLLGGKKSWTDYGKDAAGIVKKIFKGVKKYGKISRAVNGKTIAKWAVKDALGLNPIKNASKAKKLSTRLYNNLHNPKLKTNWSSHMKDMADDLVGKSGKGVAVASWADIIFQGADNLMGNLEEQKRTGMSGARVVGETVVETATNIGLGAAVGAVVAAACPATAPAFLVAAAGSFIYGKINDAVKAGTGQPISEWVADAVFDGFEQKMNAIGNAFSGIQNCVASWF